MPASVHEKPLVSALARREARVGGGGHRACPLGGNEDVGVQPGRRLDRGEVGVGELPGANLAAGERVPGLRDGEIDQRAHSTTFGTRK